VSTTGTDNTGGAEAGVFAGGGACVEGSIIPLTVPVFGGGVDIVVPVGVAPDSAPPQTLQLVEVSEFPAK